MRISTKFPVAVHTIMMIAAFGETQKINSDIIAESTGVNAVIIRNIFKSLKQADMILVSPGPGGIKLAQSPEKITLWDILVAVEPMQTEDIFNFHKQPSKHCPVGSNIYGLLKTHLDDGVTALKDELSSVTILMMVEELRNEVPDLAPLPETN